MLELFAPTYCKQQTVVRSWSWNTPVGTPPVAGHVPPVAVGGATVTRATLLVSRHPVGPRTFVSGAVEHVWLPLLKPERRQCDSGVVDQNIESGQRGGHSVDLCLVLDVELQIAIGAKVGVVFCSTAACAGDRHLRPGIAKQCRRGRTDPARAAGDEHVRT